MLPSYQLLATRIQDELVELERSVQRVYRAWAIATRVSVDQDLYLDSVALNLHSFYSGLERLFEYIAYQMDGGPPKGLSWHRELLRQMAMAVVGSRPEIISPTSEKALDEFRRFRHLVRNIYAEHLDPQKLGNLTHKLSLLWPAVKAELTTFVNFLIGVDRADSQLPR